MQGDTVRGDLSWSHLAVFYADYPYSRGLIHLGRLDDGFKPLLTRGKFPFRISARA